MQLYLTGSFPDMTPIVLERHQVLGRSMYLPDQYSLTKNIPKLDQERLGDLT
jgi:hypothetical protein